MLTRALTFAAAASLAAPAFAQDQTAPPQDDVSQVQEEIRRGIDSTQNQLDNVQERLAPRQDRTDALRNQNEELRNRQLQGRQPNLQDGERQTPRAGQERRMQPRDGQPRMNAAANAMGNASAVRGDALVRWVQQDNQAELALAHYAKQKTQNPAVRDFAEKMIEAHTAFGQKLDRLAGSSAPNADSPNRRTSAYRGGAPAAPTDPTAGPLLDPAPAADADPTAPDAIEEQVEDETLGRDALTSEDAAVAEIVDEVTDAAQPPAARDDLGAATPQDRAQNRDRAMNRDRTAMRPVQGNRNASAADLLAFRQQLKERCGKTLTQNFDRLSPADFDKAYASQQVGAHLAMIDTLAMAAEQADGQVADVFQAGRVDTQQHLTQAISLLGNVTNNNPAAPR